MIIIFLGPPEAGKGTQAKLLAKELNLPHFSIGELLRQQWEKKTGPGIEAEKYWGEKGINVPTRISFSILEKYLVQVKKGFILDNFPRTGENLKYLKRYLAEKKSQVDFVFHLNISEKEGEKRLTVRAKTQKRIDETKKLIKIRRNKGYQKEITAIKKYFQKLGVWHEIDGGLPKENVYKQIREILYGTKKQATA
ncbi:MAG: nucleoside monophosphate kinase [Patescibacteria group bacterium]|nr:nucleoside monophosphate kinase [Patescibacteria group bacterium]